MPITITEVEKVAALARLSFNENEKKKLVKELDKIVTYIEKLNQLNTDGLEPTTHVIALKNVFREDQVEQWLTQDEALKNAPHSKEGYFSVPKVIR